MWAEGSDAPEELGAQSLTDAELSAHVRDGAAWPLGLLWTRHYGLALAWASKKDPSAAEDIVAESFDLVFQALLKGGGPTESFKAYLFSTMNAQFGKHWTGQKRNSTIHDIDIVDHDSPTPDARTESDEQHDAAAAAFRSLPERWQQVIYAVDVEGRPVQEVAERFDLTPNSTSALLMRAREGLRKSWLGIMHPTRDLPEECARSVSRFGDLRWGKKNTQRRRDAREHVDSCDRCRSRWVLFVEQAGVIGLVSTGVLALSKDWRRHIAVPALAVIATASLALAAATSIAPLFSPELDGTSSPEASITDADEPVTPSAKQPPTPAPNRAVPAPDSVASSTASSQTDGTNARNADGTSQAGAGSGAASDAISTTNANAASNAGSGTTADSASDSAANGGPEGPDVLYFGDWNDWCSGKQSFGEGC